MRKFTIVVAIAFLCSFAVVRRRENEEQAEILFQETVTKVFDEESLAFHTMDEEASIGNGIHPLQDQPVDARKVLNGAFNEVILVDDGNELGWLIRSEIRSTFLREKGISFNWN